MIGSATIRRGFTMIELLGVLVLISVMVMLLLPAVQSAREMARRTSCANNLLQVSTGMQMYHGTYQHLPQQLSGTDGSTQPGLDNDRRLSVFVALLPFMGQPELVSALSEPLKGSSQAWGENDWSVMMEDGSMFDSSQVSNPNDSITWSIGGPEPFDGRYPPWRIELPVLRCPSDPGIGSPALARSNYAICLGDSVLTSESGPMKEVAGTFTIDPTRQEQCDAAMRGALVPRVVTRLADISDGLANTILFGEMATDLGDNDTRTFPIAATEAKLLRDQPNWARENGKIDVERPQFWKDVDSSSKLSAMRGARRGFRWADGMPIYTVMNTILPPNREITLARDRDDTWGILPSSSRHQGGAHVAFADGAIQFITDSIEAGNENAATVYVGSQSVPGSESPYGLWGAMGTRSNHELISGGHELVSSGPASDEGG